MPYKVFENSQVFCIKCNINKVCNGKCNYSYGGSVLHYSSPLLSIAINSIKNGKYNNPMNIIFDEYFATSKITCEDIRCKEGIIEHYLTTYYNDFSYPKIFIFLIDTFDVKTLKNNYNLIKKLFNPILIIDQEEYHIVGYYLLPFENHFILLFENNIDDGILKHSSWYLYDDYYDTLFEVIGSIDKILENTAIYAIIYLKK